MMNITIENMSPEHIFAIAEIEKLCFSTPWSEGGLSEELDNQLACFYVLKDNGNVAGYIGSHNIMGEVYITNVAVHPRYRRKGYGEMLVKHLMDSCRSSDGFVTLEVRESNEPARKLYSKLGFLEVGKRKNFYEYPTEDAILMTYKYGEGDK